MNTIDQSQWKCMPNCGECCGIVLIPKETARKHFKKVQRKIIKG